MIIEAKQIVKTFGSLEVLKGINFGAEKGEIVSIMGASGAGKSTLLQILGTLLTPDSGSLIIDNQSVFDLSSKKLSSFRGHKLGFVFQAHHLLPEFTAVENIMIPSMIIGFSRKESEKKAMAMLEILGLKDRYNHKPSELSGGEQQRVAIGRALINKPAVVFGDEPTGNLDSATKIEIQKVFFDLREALGQTFILVTHDIQLAKLCDRCLTMRDGLFI